MKIKDVKVYEDWKAKNTDDYGSAIFRYAERWADLMELEMANGAEIKDIAERLSNEADTEGITGFMHGVSVNVLSHCWEHGEELKKWYNGEYNYDGDGVVNPAILTVETDK
jgi:hypothetical protein